MVIQIQYFKGFYYICRHINDFVRTKTVTNRIQQYYYMLNDVFTVLLPVEIPNKYMLMILNYELNI